MPIYNIFRFENGTAVLVSYTDVKYMRINMDYYGKETLMATHSSFILPKESPLVVRKKSRKFKRAPSKLRTSLRLHRPRFLLLQCGSGIQEF